jgi:putative DNA primase/helicase
MPLKVSDVAQGRWLGILSRFGLTDKQLSGKHTACPMCGGKDRFRFDDKDGRGTWFCSHCRAGDGIALVMGLKGYSFKEAAHEIEQVVGGIEPVRAAPVADDGQKVARLRQVWNEASPLAPGDEATRYLARRGLVLEAPPNSLRLHPGLAYYEDGRFMGKFTAILALVVCRDRQVVTIHRTYLKDGKKAPVQSPRKIMPGKPVSGAAIRLTEASECLGIAEGIETALAASALFSVPVWSCINAHGIETFDPPAGVKRVIVFADNDESFTGQKAAYVAAYRLQQLGFQVDVKIPSVRGDWLDVKVLEISHVATY